MSLCVCVCVCVTLCVCVCDCVYVCVSECMRVRLYLCLCQLVCLSELELQPQSSGKAGLTGVEIKDGISGLQVASSTACSGQSDQLHDRRLEP